MDVTNIVTQVRTRFDHNQNKKILKEKYQSKMMFALFGGMWEASPNLICILNAMESDLLVLEDLYNVPVQINRKELLEKTKMHWQEQMNGWANEFLQLSKNR